ncbi:hypothetical protein HNR46_003126 [Haloferula luteola]|uniref:Uncharacterized protein n=1 Tax=Haloferula luteola TaxID=595692 RepID=A0A840V3K2_9BACT|nr:hypothetical protein [Haloferula luteola]MBB5352877.1 hypothetical protein [Haloferula luteola]
MKNPYLTVLVISTWATIARGQLPIDSIDLSGPTLTGIHVGETSYTSLVAPTSFVDLKGSTDYIHLSETAPSSLAAAIGSFDIESGSLNHHFQVQFGQPLFGSTLIYLMANENDATINDRMTIYPLDATGQRMGKLSAYIRLLDYGSLPVLAVNTYFRTTEGADNGTLNRTVGGIAFSLDDLGIGNIAGVEGLEFEPTTNDFLDPQEIGLAQAGSSIDPVLLRDVTTADPDLDFGTTFHDGGELPERTIRYVNGGPTQNIPVDSVTITAGFEITAISKNGSPLAPPFNLAVGDSIEISVQPLPSPDSEPVSGTLQLNENTLEIDATSTVLRAGARMNPNPKFADGAGTAVDWAGGHARLSTGLTPGSASTIRIFGIGDPSGSSVGGAAQSTSVPNGASNFEAVFLFSPVADFSPYSGAAADGGFTDRAMQYLLLASDTTVASGATITPADTANVLINLAYMPDGITSNGTPGFYVFDGLTESWQLAIAADLAGSVDANADGVLDPATGDTVAAYRVAISGSGFGTSSAFYQIQVAQVTESGLTDELSSSALTIWHGTSGETTGPAAHLFTSADQSDSNELAGYVPPFWVDFSALYQGTQAGAALTVAGTPSILFTKIEDSPIAQGTLTLRNDGDSENLEITAVNFENAAFSVAEALPLLINPGATANLTLNWEASTSAARTTFEVVSSDTSSSPIESLIAGATSNAALNPNFDFEVPGNDPSGADPFAFWNDGTQIRAVPGLLAGSQTAARVNGGSAMGTTWVRSSPYWSGGGTWVAEAVFAIGGTNNRIFNFKVREELNGENYTEINIRYEASKWQVFHGIPGNGGSWIDLVDLSASPLAVSVDADDNGSLDDPGDTKVPYRLRISGSGWDGSSPPTFSFTLMAADGTLLGSAQNRTELLNGFVVEDVPTTGPNYLEVRNSGSAFWVDDIVIATAAAGTGVRILDVTGGPGGLTLHYDSGGAAVRIERSAPGLDDFQEIAGGETSGIYLDTTAPSGRAFYRIELE